MIRRWFAVILNLSLLVAAGCSTAPSIVQLSTASSAQVHPFPVPIVVLDGSSEQLGQEHGKQLGPSIRLLHEKYLQIFMKNRTQWLLASAAAAVFETEISPAHLAEIQSLSKACGVDESQTMLAQCFLDISQMTACSTITLPASAAPDHIARFGRNLDFWSLNVADKYTTLFIVRPNDGRYAFAAVGWPGMIGVLSGMNEHGLTLANMEVDRSPRFPQAMPYTLLYRTVLEKCRTVNEAVHLLKTTPIQTANNLMLMDASGNRAVVELTPSSVHVRRGPPDAALISTNHQRDQDMDTPGRCWRYDYLHQAAAKEFGQISQNAMQQMLSRVGVQATLQSMVFEPANRVIYLAAGTDAAHRDFGRLDLNPYFPHRPQPGTVMAPHGIQTP